MSLPPPVSIPTADPQPAQLGPVRLAILIALCAAFVACLVSAFLTRDAMQHLPVRGTGGLSVRPGFVDQSPWQTIQSLAPLAVSAEEAEFAQQAQHLADHEVDQAFAAALREATLQTQARTLTGEALALSQRVQQLQQLVKQDQATVKQLSGTDKPDSASADQPGGSDVDIAKAQLGLDSDELADAAQDLARATGDQRPQIQSELTEREGSMKQYDSQARGANQTAVIGSSRYATLSGRLGAWRQQRMRLALISQAEEQARADIRTFTERHSKLEAQAKAGEQASSSTDRAAHLGQLAMLSTTRQLLSIYDDRMQTEQRLAAIYQKWAEQVNLQHRIVLHLILQSCAWVAVILMGMVLGNTLVRHFMHYPVLERRRGQTLRAILELAIQIVGVLLILLVLFGAPHQTPTIVGLTTAALTIALQDFIVAFFGWFVLMGKKGVRVGDAVEINGVGGQVIEIGLLSTTLLETGKLADAGYATGRRISFLNSYAIRGQYFNFSTSGQWMLDQFQVTVPASDKMAVIVDAILNAVEQVTGDNARIAEQEWRRVTHGENINALSAAPSVNVRPTGNDFGLEVRYVTRAADRIETKNRLYRRVVELLHQPGGSA